MCLNYDAEVVMVDEVCHALLGNELITVLFEGGLNENGMMSFKRMVSFSANPRI